MSDPASTPPIEYRNPMQADRRGPSGWKVLAWTIAAICAFGLFVALTLPSLGRARETAKRSRCASNLRQIGTAIFLYANENRGQLPPDWATLLATQDLVPEVFTCPSSAIERATGETLEARITDMLSGDHLSYYWTGRGLQSNQLTPTIVLAFEFELHVPVDNAKTTGMNVLLGDRSVQFVDERAAKAVLAQHLAGVWPIRMPPATTQPAGIERLQFRFQDRIVSPR